MQLKKRISALLLAFLLWESIPAMAYARQLPDATREGTISITMTYDGAAVSGGALTLYQVGQVWEEDGDQRFVLTADFAESGILLDDISSPGLAELLAEYASRQRLDGEETEIGGDGRAAFGGLALGLYLVVQTQAADGYEAIAPFLVSVPIYEDGTYLYEVDATPKMGILTEAADPEPTIPEPTAPEPTTPAPTVPETAPSETAGTEIITPGPTPPTLPQTGQLNWPVPALAVLGLCLFLAGWMLRFGFPASGEADSGGPAGKEGNPL